ncbi:type II toxin-antitoxin system VapC family toxin [Opitutaceae bacterium]|nr:type II toxin-antitoxin system VapC family toxin [Opitutaceae bacterium]
MTGYLLDTHSMLWALFTPSKLSAEARRTLTAPEHRIIVSSISFWEISIKFTLGKLTLPRTLPDELPDAVRSIGFEIREVTASELASFHQLPLDPSHRDPFDRMLVWIALQQNLTFVSRDKRLSLYADRGLKRVW